ncbi:hypothetical protein E2562_023267 [Oryza meyeriana var. granulata]|uniref:Uncharacterized protein n=1 Tax=Oryza meyeriana var. granulata TaxID=110450 RepID=A0A6G1DM59_9ORYZ|nr:hypothetical protein E2562_023267 [Oryza meyeriana var. granulata]
MDPVEVEAKEQPPDKDNIAEAYVETNPAGHFIRVEPIGVGILELMLGINVCGDSAFYIHAFSTCSVNGQCI